MLLDVRMYHFCPVELLHCHTLILVMSSKSCGAELQATPDKMAERKNTARKSPAISTRLLKVYIVDSARGQYTVWAWPNTTAHT